MSDEKSSGNVSTDPKKQKARELWERLAKSRPGPNNQDLLYLARFVPLLSTVAVKSLLSRELTADELKELIQHVPASRSAACTMLLKRPAAEVSEDDLRFAVTHAKSEDAARLLLKRYPTESTLMFVERNLDSLNEAVAKIRSREKTKDILKEIDRML